MLVWKVALSPSQSEKSRNGSVWLRWSRRFMSRRVAPYPPRARKSLLSFLVAKVWKWQLLVARVWTYQIWVATDHHGCKNLEMPNFVLESLDMSLGPRPGKQTLSSKAANWFFCFGLCSCPLIQLFCKDSESYSGWIGGGGGRVRTPFLPSGIRTPADPKIPSWNYFELYNFGSGP